MIDYLTTNDVVHLNERVIRAYGGSFTPPENLREEETLNALTETVQSGEYRKPADKAAVYFHAIISKEIFLDANERTALLAARTFLVLNGGVFHKKLKAVARNERQIPKNGKGNQEIWLNLIAETKAGRLEADDLREWFGRNVNSAVR